MEFVQQSFHTCEWLAKLYSPDWHIFSINFSFLYQLTFYFTVVKSSFLNDSLIFINHITLHLCRGTNKLRDHSHCWAIACWLFSSARLSGIGWRQQVQMRWQPWGGQRYSWGAADRMGAEKGLRREPRREDLDGKQEDLHSCAGVGFQMHFRIREHTVILTCWFWFSYWSSYLIYTHNHLRGYQWMLRAPPLRALQTPPQLLVWGEEVQKVELADQGASSLNLKQTAPDWPPSCSRDTVCTSPEADWG